jgi:hypothetical protein
MTFTDEELELVRFLCLDNYDADRLDDLDYKLLNIADKIEKYLGIE